MKRIFNYDITMKDSCHTVEQYLHSIGYSRHTIIHLKKTENAIQVNHQWAYVKTRLNTGDLLSICLIEEGSSPNIVPISMPLSIIYEDRDIMVLNKASDTPIHPSQNNYTNTLANGISYYFWQKGENFVFRCINRLDRDTTGLLIIAKHMLSASILSQMMVNREIHRTYRAFVTGVPNQSGTIDAPIGRVEGSSIERRIDYDKGETAITHYRLISSKNNLSLLELTLETGRTHQIRVHLKHMGYPIPGDFIYNPDQTWINRQALHSFALDFNHPITGEPLHFTAPLPPDMANLL